MAPIWSEFTKTRDGKELKFRIKELPSEKYDDLIQLFIDYFINEEPVHKAARIVENVDSLNEFKNVLYQTLHKEKYQMDACYLVNEAKEKLVGGSIMVLERKGDPEFPWDELYATLRTEEMKMFINLCKIMGDLNVRKKYDLDSYFDDRGICVHPDYRKIGIAGELFKARVATCKHYRVPMTGAWMSSYGTQIAASRLGWKTVYELSYADYSKASGVKFEGTPPTCKLMVMSANK